MNEHERAAADRVVEQVFLSPRVVDSATLAEFAQSLGELLRRAAEQREALRRTVAEGESVAATLRDTTGQAAEKLRPAVKLIPTIEQKLAQAEQAIGRAAEAAATAERAAGEAARVAADEGIESLREARRALDEALGRAKGLEARLGQLAERAELAVERLDAECKGRLDTAARHAQDVLGTVSAELDARAEQALERLSGLIEERRAAAEAALAEPLAIGTGGAGADAPDADMPEAGTNGALAATEARAAAEQARMEIEDLFASLRRRAREEIASLEAEAESTETRAADAAVRVHETEELARAAEARLAGVRRELAAVDERGREIATMASQALAAFDEELTGRMHAVREMMEQLASVTEGPREQIPTAPPRASSATAPPRAAEVKPGREPGFVRIDRPVQGPGLPGPLRI